MEKLQSGCGEGFNLAPWMQFVAFVTAIDVAFSLSFVKTGSDVGGLIGTLHKLNPLTKTLVILPEVVAFIQQPWLFAMVTPKQEDETAKDISQRRQNTKRYINMSHIL